jgi:hypothetical protein
VQQKILAGKATANLTSHETARVSWSENNQPSMLRHAQARTWTNLYTLPF